MSGLDAIGINTEGDAGPADRAHNAIPVLHEIRHALQTLSSVGEPTIIDLSSIPFMPGDKEQLLEILGNGEVTATVDAMGLSRIQETAFPGVWLVTHFSADEKEVASHIEVTRIPALLETPADDVTDSISALEERLSRET